MDSGLGGFSFETNQPPSHPTPPPAQNDPFNLMGLDFGGSSPQPANNPQGNQGFGGDLLGFGGNAPQPPSQPVAQRPPPQNNLMGDDLMGFGVSSTPVNQTSQHPQPPS